MSTYHRVRSRVTTPIAAREVNETTYGYSFSDLENGVYTRKDTSVGLFYPPGKEVCDDYLTSPPYPDNLLTLTKTTCRLGSVNGYRARQLLTSYGTHVRYTVRNGGGQPMRDANWWPVTMPSINWSYYATKMLANASFESPVVDVPLFIYELKDFPAMLKHVGDLLVKGIHPRDAPDAWLAYHFGWAPLISDLKTLHYLAESINARIQRLANLRRTMRVRAKLDFIKQAKYYEKVATDVINSENFLRRTHIDYTAEIWGSMRLKPTQQNLDSLNGLIAEYAKRDSKYDFALGLRTLRPATLWNAYPWTWLLDYFANIGDFLEASYGIFPLQYSNLNLMAHSEFRYKSEMDEPSPRYKVVTCEKTYSRKQRYVQGIVSPRTTFVQWFTPMHQMTVLALVTSSSIKTAYS